MAKYDDNKVLEVEAVRLRPGMYIGSTGSRTSSYTLGNNRQFHMKSPTIRKQDKCHH